MKLLPLIFLVLANQIIAQETKKIKAKISKDDDEIYYVLKADATIKHGSYELYDRNKIKLKGQYKKGLKDNIWTEYSYSGERVNQGNYQDDLKSGTWYYYSDKEVLRAKGDYSKDKRTGTWDFFDLKGKLIQQFNFKENRLKQIDTSSFVWSRSFIQGGIYDGLCYYDAAAKYRGTESELLKFLADNIKYPPEAKANKIQGRVVVSYLVKENGHISDIKILREIGGGCEEESIRVLKLTSGNWEPAIFEGQKVNTEFIMPIYFQLN